MLNSSYFEPLRKQQISKEHIGRITNYVPNKFTKYNMLQSHFEHDFNSQLSQRIALEFVKKIKSRRKFKREVPVFADTVRNYLLYSHEYNMTVFKITQSYPYTEEFSQLLLQYVLIECQILNRKENCSKKRESQTQDRILRILLNIHRDYFESKMTPRKNITEKSAKAIFNIFIQIRTNYKTNYRILENMTVVLLKKIGQFEKIDALKRTPISLSTDPSISGFFKNVITSDYGTDESSNSSPICLDDPEELSSTINEETRPHIEIKEEFEETVTSALAKTDPKSKLVWTICLDNDGSDEDLLFYCQEVESKRKAKIKNETEFNKPDSPDVDDGVNKNLKYTYKHNIPIQTSDKKYVIPQSPNLNNSLQNDQAHKSVTNINAEMEVDDEKPFVENPKTQTIPTVIATIDLDSEDDDDVILVDHTNEKKIPPALKEDKPNVSTSVTYSKVSNFESTKMLACEKNLITVVNNKNVNEQCEPDTTESDSGLTKIVTSVESKCENGISTTTEIQDFAKEIESIFNGNINESTSQIYGEQQNNSDYTKILSKINFLDTDIKIVSVNRNEDEHLNLKYVEEETINLAKKEVQFNDELCEFSKQHRNELLTEQKSTVDQHLSKDLTLSSKNELVKDNKLKSSKETLNKNELVVDNRKCSVEDLIRDNKTKDYILNKKCLSEEALLSSEDELDKDDKINSYKEYGVKSTDKLLIEEDSNQHISEDLILSSDEELDNGGKIKDSKKNFTNLHNENDNILDLQYVHENLSLASEVLLTKDDTISNEHISEDLMSSKGEFIEKDEIKSSGESGEHCNKEILTIKENVDNQKHVSENLIPNSEDELTNQDKTKGFEGKVLLPNEENINKNYVPKFSEGDKTKSSEEYLENCKNEILSEKEHSIQKHLPEDCILNFEDGLIQENFDKSDKKLLTETENVMVHKQFPEHLILSSKYDSTVEDTKDLEENLNDYNTELIDKNVPENHFSEDELFDSNKIRYPQKKSEHSNEELLTEKENLLNQRLSPDLILSLQDELGETKSVNKNLGNYNKCSITKKENLLDQQLSDDLRLSSEDEMNEDGERNNSKEKSENCSREISTEEQQSHIVKDLIISSGDHYDSEKNLKISFEKESSSNIREDLSTNSKRDSVQTLYKNETSDEEDHNFNDLINRFDENKADHFKEELVENCVEELSTKNKDDNTLPCSSKQNDDIKPFESLIQKPKEYLEHCNEERLFENLISEPSLETVSTQFDYSKIHLTEERDVTEKETPYLVSEDINNPNIENVSLCDDKLICADPEERGILKQQKHRKNSGEIQITSLIDLKNHSDSEFIQNNLTNSMSDIEKQKKEKNEYDSNKDDNNQIEAIDHNLQVPKIDDKLEVIQNVNDSDSLIKQQSLERAEIQIPSIIHEHKSNMQKTHIIESTQNKSGSSDLEKATIEKEETVDIKSSNDYILSTTNDNRISDKNGLSELTESENIYTDNKLAHQYSENNIETEEEEISHDNTEIVESYEHQSIVTDEIQNIPDTFDYTSNSVTVSCEKFQSEHRKNNICKELEEHTKSENKILVKHTVSEKPSVLTEFIQEAKVYDSVFCTKPERLFKDNYNSYYLYDNDSTNQNYSSVSTMKEEKTDFELSSTSEIVSDWNIQKEEVVETVQPSKMLILAIAAEMKRKSEETNQKIRSKPKRSLKKNINSKLGSSKLKTADINRPLKIKNRKMKKKLKKSEEVEDRRVTRSTSRKSLVEFNKEDINENNEKDPNSFETILKPQDFKSTSPTKNIKVHQLLDSNTYKDTTDSDSNDSENNKLYIDDKKIEDHYPTNVYNKTTSQEHLQFCYEPEVDYKIDSKVGNLKPKSQKPKTKAEIKLYSPYVAIERLNSKNLKKQVTSKKYYADKIKQKEATNSKSFNETKRMKLDGLSKRKTNLKFSEGITIADVEAVSNQSAVITTNSETGNILTEYKKEVKFGVSNTDKSQENKSTLDEKINRITSANPKSSASVVTELIHKGSISSELETQIETPSEKINVKNKKTLQKKSKSNDVRKIKQNDTSKSKSSSFNVTGNSDTEYILAELESTTNTQQNTILEDTEYIQKKAKSKKCDVDKSKPIKPIKPKSVITDMKKADKVETKTLFGKSLPEHKKSNLQKQGKSKIPNARKTKRKLKNSTLNITKNDIDYTLTELETTLKTSNQNTSIEGNNYVQKKGKSQDIDKLGLNTIKSINSITTETRNADRNERKPKIPIDKIITEDKKNLKKQNKSKSSDLDQIKRKTKSSLPKTLTTFSTNDELTTMSHTYQNTEKLNPINLTKAKSSIITDEGNADKSETKINTPTENRKDLQKQIGSKNSDKSNLKQIDTSKLKTFDTGIIKKTEINLSEIKIDSKRSKENLNFDIRVKSKCSVSNTLKRIKGIKPKNSVTINMIHTDSNDTSSNLKIIDNSVIEDTKEVNIGVLPKKLHYKYKNLKKSTADPLNLQINSVTSNNEEKSEGTILKVKQKDEFISDTSSSLGVIFSTTNSTIVKEKIVSSYEDKKYTTPPKLRNKRINSTCIEAVTIDLSKCKNTVKDTTEKLEKRLENETHKPDTNENSLVVVNTPHHFENQFSLPSYKGHIDSESNLAHKNYIDPEDIPLNLRLKNLENSLNYQMNEHFDTDKAIDLRKPDSSKLLISQNETSVASDEKAIFQKENSSQLEISEHVMVCDEITEKVADDISTIEKIKITKENASDDTEKERKNHTKKKIKVLFDVTISPRKEPVFNTCPPIHTTKGITMTDTNIPIKMDDEKSKLDMPETSNGNCITSKSFEKSDVNDSKMDVSSNKSSFLYEEKEIDKLIEKYTSDDNKDEGMRKYSTRHKSETRSIFDYHDKEKVSGNKKNMKKATLTSSPNSIDVNYINSETHDANSRCLRSSRSKSCAAETEKNMDYSELKKLRSRSLSTHENEEILDRNRDNENLTPVSRHHVMSDDQNVIDKSFKVSLPISDINLQQKRSSKKSVTSKLKKPKKKFINEFDIKDETNKTKCESIPKSTNVEEPLATTPNDTPTVENKLCTSYSSIADDTAKFTEANILENEGKQSALKDIDKFEITNTTIEDNLSSKSIVNVETIIVTEAENDDDISAINSVENEPIEFFEVNSLTNENDLYFSKSTVIEEPMNEVTILENEDEIYESKSIVGDELVEGFEINIPINGDKLSASKFGVDKIVDFDEVKLKNKDELSISESIPVGELIENIENEDKVSELKSPIEHKAIEVSPTYGEELCFLKSAMIEEPIEVFVDNIPENKDQLSVSKNFTEFELIDNQENNELSFSKTNVLDEYLEITNKVNDSKNEVELSVSVFTDESIELSEVNISHNEPIELSNVKIPKNDYLYSSKTTMEDEYLETTEVISKNEDEVSTSVYEEESIDESVANISDNRDELSLSISSNLNEAVEIPKVDTENSDLFLSKIIATDKYAENAEINISKNEKLCVSEFEDEPTKMNEVNISENDDKLKYITVDELTDINEVTISKNDKLTILKSIIVDEPTENNEVNISENDDKLTILKSTTVDEPSGINEVNISENDDKVTILKSTIEDEHTREPTEINEVNISENNDKLTILKSTTVNETDEPTEINEVDISENDGKLTILKSTIEDEHRGEPTEINEVNISKNVDKLTILKSTIENEHRGEPTEINEVNISENDDKVTILKSTIEDEHRGEPTEINEVNISENDDKVTILKSTIEDEYRGEPTEINEVNISENDDKLTILKSTIEDEHRGEPTEINEVNISENDDKLTILKSTIEDEHRGEPTEINDFNISENDDKLTILKSTIEDEHRGEPTEINEVNISENDDKLTILKSTSVNEHTDEPTEINEVNILENDDKLTILKSTTVNEHTDEPTEINEVNISENDNLALLKSTTIDEHTENAEVNISTIENEFSISTSNTNESVDLIKENTSVNEYELESLNPSDVGETTHIHVPLNKNELLQQFTAVNESTDINNLTTQGKELNSLKPTITLHESVEFIEENEVELSFSKSIPEQPFEFIDPKYEFEKSNKSKYTVANKSIKVIDCILENSNVTNSEKDKEVKMIPTIDEDILENKKCFSSTNVQDQDKIKELNVCLENITNNHNNLGKAYISEIKKNDDNLKCLALNSAFYDNKEPLEPPGSLRDGVSKINVTEIKEISNSGSNDDDVSTINSRKTEVPFLDENTIILTDLSNRKTFLEDKDSLTRDLSLHTSSSVERNEYNNSEIIKKSLEDIDIVAFKNNNNPIKSEKFENVTSDMKNTELITHSTETIIPTNTEINKTSLVEEIKENKTPQKINEKVLSSNKVMPSNKDFIKIEKNSERTERFAQNKIINKNNSYLENQEGLETNKIHIEDKPGANEKNDTFIDVPTNSNITEVIKIVEPCKMTTSDLIKSLRRKKQKKTNRYKKKVISKEEKLLVKNRIKDDKEKDVYLSSEQLFDTVSDVTIPKTDNLESSLSIEEKEDINDHNILTHLDSEIQNITSQNVLNIDDKSVRTIKTEVNGNITHDDYKDDHEFIKKSIAELRDQTIVELEPKNKFSSKDIDELDKNEQQKIISEKESAVLTINDDQLLNPKGDTNQINKVLAAVSHGQSTDDHKANQILTNSEIGETLDLSNYDQTFIQQIGDLLKKHELKLNQESKENANTNVNRNENSICQEKLEDIAHSDKKMQSSSEAVSLDEELKKQKNYPIFTKKRKTLSERGEPLCKKCKSNAVSDTFDQITATNSYMKNPSNLFESEKNKQKKHVESIVIHLKENITKDIPDAFYENKLISTEEVGSSIHNQRVLNSTLLRTSNPIILKNKNIPETPNNPIPEGTTEFPDAMTLVETSNTELDLDMLPSDISDFFRSFFKKNTRDPVLNFHGIANENLGGCQTVQKIGQSGAQLKASTDGTNDHNYSFNTRDPVMSTAEYGTDNMSLNAKEFENIIYSMDTILDLDLPEDDKPIRREPYTSWDNEPKVIVVHNEQYTDDIELKEFETSSVISETIDDTLVTEPWVSTDPIINTEVSSSEQYGAESELKEFEAPSAICETIVKSIATEPWIANTEITPGKPYVSESVLNEFQTPSTFSETIDNSIINEPWLATESVKATEVMPEQKFIISEGKAKEFQKSNAISETIENTLLTDPWVATKSIKTIESIPSEPFEARRDLCDSIVRSITTEPWRETEVIKNIEVSDKQYVSENVLKDFDASNNISETITESTITKPWLTTEPTENTKSMSEQKHNSENIVKEFQTATCLLSNTVNESTAVESWAIDSVNDTKVTIQNEEANINLFSSLLVNPEKSITANTQNNGNNLVPKPWVEAEPTISTQVGVNLTENENSTQNNLEQYNTLTLAREPITFNTNLKQDNYETSTITSNSLVSQPWSQIKGTEVEIFTNVGGTNLSFHTIPCNDKLDKPNPYKTPNISAEDLEDNAAAELENITDSGNNKLDVSSTKNEDTNLSTGSGNKGSGKSERIKRLIEFHRKLQTSKQAKLKPKSSDIFIPNKKCSKTSPRNWIKSTGSPITTSSPKNSEKPATTDTSDSPKNSKINENNATNENELCGLTYTNDANVRNKENTMSHRDKKNSREENTSDTQQISNLDKFSNITDKTPVATNKNDISVNKGKYVQNNRTKPIISTNAVSKETSINTAISNDKKKVSNFLNNEIYQKNEIPKNKRTESENIEDGHITKNIQSDVNTRSEEHNTKYLAVNLKNLEMTKKNEDSVQFKDLEIQSEKDYTPIKHSKSEDTSNMDKLYGNSRFDSFNSPQSRSQKSSPYESSEAPSNIFDIVKSRKRKATKLYTTENREVDKRSKLSNNQKPYENQFDQNITYYTTQTGSERLYSSQLENLKLKITTDSAKPSSSVSEYGKHSKSFSSQNQSYTSNRPSNYSSNKLLNNRVSSYERSGIKDSKKLESHKRSVYGGLSNKKKLEKSDYRSADETFDQLRLQGNINPNFTENKKIPSSSKNQRYEHSSIHLSHKRSSNEDLGYSTKRRSSEDCHWKTERGNMRSSQRYLPSRNFSESSRNQEPRSSSEYIKYSQHSFRDRESSHFSRKSVSTSRPPTFSSHSNHGSGHSSSAEAYKKSDASSSESSHMYYNKPSLSEDRKNEQFEHLKKFVQIQLHKSTKENQIPTGVNLLNLFYRKLTPH